MNLLSEEVRRIIEEEVASMLELENPVAPQSTMPEQQNDGTSQEVYKIFSDFNYKLNNYENQLTRYYQSQLNKMFKGKKVIANASVGYGQVKKEHTILVKEVQLIFYYKEYVVALIGRDNDDRKDKEYILDDSFDIKLAPQTAVTQEPASPNEAPKQTTKPVVQANKSQSVTGSTPTSAPTPTSGVTSGGTPSPKI
jgi:hypothetical protein